MYRGNGLLIGIYAYSPKRKAVSFTRSRACFLFCVPGLQVSGLVAVAVCCSCGCFRTGFHVLLYILLLLYPVAVYCLVRILLSGLKYLAIWSCHLYLVLFTDDCPCPWSGLMLSCSCCRVLCPASWSCCLYPCQAIALLYLFFCQAITLHLFLFPVPGSCYTYFCSLFYKLNTVGIR